MVGMKKEREGFSLIELIIAIAIVAIVMASVILLVSYSTNSMRRTTNAVNLQNETKDALLHMTTYVQEASDAHWDSDKKALIVVKKQKNLEGDPVSLEVSHYFFRPETTPGGGGGDDPAPGGVPAATTAPSGETRGVICFYKKTYDKNYDSSNPNLWRTKFLNSDGSINYSAISLDTDYDNLVSTNGVQSLLFAKNVIKFECVVNENAVDSLSTPGPTATTDPLATPTPVPTATPTPDPMATAAPTPTPITIGGKYVVITINMKNELGDAQFESSKEVFMRNR